MQVVAELLLGHCFTNEGKLVQNFSATYGKYLMLRGQLELIKLIQSLSVCVDFCRLFTMLMYSLSSIQWCPWLQQSTHWCHNQHLPRRPGYIRARSASAEPWSVQPSHLSCARIILARCVAQRWHIFKAWRHAAHGMCRDGTCAQTRALQLPRIRRDTNSRP